MKKGVIGLLLMACVFASCQNDAYDPNYNPELGARVPDNFDWSTTKALTVNVDVNDEYNGKYYYAVRVYDKAPGEGVLPVAASGKVNKDLPFSQKIVVPATVTKLYIVQVFKNADASEVTTKKEVAIDGESLTCSFGHSSTMRSVSTRGNEQSIIVENGKVIDITSVKEKFQQYTVKEGGTLNFKVGGELFQWEITIEDGGKMTAANGTKLDMKNSDLINYGEVHIYDIEFDNGSIFQNGNAMTGKNEGGCFYAHNLILNNGNGNGSDKRELGERSYTSCETLTLVNNKLTLKTSAWLKCGKLIATQGGACTLQGEGATIGDTEYTGLATIEKIVIESKLTVGKNILVECDESDLKQDNIVEDASDMITIIGTACNDGGFGNNEEHELGTYTYIIEDMYPTQGDYDMNDIVVSLTATQKEDALTIKGQLKAVGAAYKIIPYIEVAGQTQPLISTPTGNPLEAHFILTKNETSDIPINTVIGQPFYPAQSFELEFDNVKEGLNIDDIDFYITANDTKIHWNMYSQEEKATWGMRIPGSDFRWPQEKVSITKAYPSFSKWFEDKSYPWYNDHKDLNLIYNQQ